MKYWREIAFILALFWLCSPAFANEPLPIAATNWRVTVPTLTPPVSQLVKVQEAPPQKKGAVDWKLALMIGAVHGAVEFDRNSTYAALRRCPTCREGNPILAPIIHNKPATALVMHGFGGLSDFAMWKLKSKGSKIWWLPGAIKIGVHVFAGWHNSRIK